MEVTGPRSHSLLVTYLGLEARPSDSQNTLVPSQTQRGAFTNRLSGLPPPQPPRLHIHIIKVFYKPNENKATSFPSPTDLYTMMGSQIPCRPSIHLSPQHMHT